MKLSELIKIKEVKIPDLDITVKIKSELSWLEYLEGIKITDSSERGVYTITKMIISWDITDDDGKTLPVTPENVKVLPTRVAQVLMSEFNEMFDEKLKKKANS